MKKIIIFLVLLCLTGCKTVKEYVEVPVEVVKTEYISNLQKDSVYVRDSIFQYLKGDTFYIEKAKILYKEKLRVDTVCRIDSIPKIIKIEKTEIKEVSPWYERYLIIWSVISLVIICFIIKRKFFSKKG